MEMKAPFPMQLALQGGGAKLCLLVAAMEAVEKLQTENKIKISRIAGTSAGAIVGALFAAKVPMAAVRNHLINLSSNLKSVVPGRTKAGILMRFLWGTPIWKTEPVRQQLIQLFKIAPKNILRFNDMETTVHVTATDIRSSTMVSNKPSDEVIQWLLDSCALPFAFRAPYRGTDSILVDGGICENLPSDLLADHTKTDGPIVGISFRKQSGKAPEGRIEFCQGLLDASINNSMERAKRSLRGRVYEIDTEIGTFDFKKAFSDGLSGEYGKVVLEANAFFNQFVEDEKAKESQQEKNKVLNTFDSWLAAASGDHWAKEYNKIMGSAHRMYQLQHREQKVKYLHGSVVVTANCLRGGLPDEIKNSFVFTMDKPLYCHGIGVSFAPHDIYLKSEIAAYREKDGKKINLILMPMHDPVHPEERELLMFFDPVLAPGEGPYVVSYKDSLKDAMLPLRENGKDELYTIPARTDSNIGHIDLVLYVPNEFKDMHMVEKADSPYPGRLMNDAELVKYIREAPVGFRTLGWIGENVPAGTRFGTDILRDRPRG